jgi:hypothetical protein
MTQVRFVSEGLKSKFDLYYLNLLHNLPLSQNIGEILVKVFSFRSIGWSIALHASVMTFSRSGILTIHSRSVCQCIDILGKQTLMFILQLLSKEEFLEGMVELVEPLSDEAIRNLPQAQRWVTVALQKRIDLT